MLYCEVLLVWLVLTWLLLDYCIKLLCYCRSRTLNYRYERAKQQIHQAAYICARLTVYLSHLGAICSLPLFKKRQFVLVVIVSLLQKSRSPPDNSWSNIKRGGFTEEWWLLMLSVFKQANQSGPDNQTISSFISPLVDSLIWRRESSICK